MERGTGGRRRRTGYVQGHRVCLPFRQAAALGFWLAREREQLAVPGRVLEELRTLAPAGLRYALGARPGAGKTAGGWNVILPAAVVERRFEGL